MITQFKYIENIGRFESYTAKPNTEFKKINFIYSENAKGKTTLTAIIRSLSTGESVYVDERRQIRSTNPPKVVLSMEGQENEVIFDNSKWSLSYPNIFIFDDLFIHENVSSGLEVNPEHRKGLHNIIIGRQGVSLARSLELITESIDGYQTTLKNKENEIKQKLPEGITVDDFCGIQIIPDLEEKIKESKRQVDAIEKADKIQASDIFKTIEFPTLDFETVDSVLKVQLENLEQKALDAVHTHFEKIGELAEPWISQGMQYISPNNETDVCPFCGLDLNDSHIIEHYRAYFGEEYNKHKDEIDVTITLVKQSLSGDRLLKFQSDVENERKKVDFWKDFVDSPKDEIDTTSVIDVCKNIRKTYLSLLTTKSDAPLDGVDFSDDLKEMTKLFLTLGEKAKSTNESLLDVNAKIEELRNSLDQDKQVSIMADYIRLLATKIRFDSDMNQLCGEYLEAKGLKKAAEKEKSEIRTNLDAHRKEVIPLYQDAINNLLKKFNSTFRITEVEASNPRGIPSSTYCLEINKESVPIDGSEIPVGKPSFKSTLSSGDRNTLALAFFFSWLSHEKDLSSFIIVIDDPVSSLDDARMLTTAQEIRRLTSEVKQLIVLSHSKRLLCSINNFIGQQDVSSLEIRDSTSGSEIVQWDINEESITEYDRNHTTLREYNELISNNYRSAAVSIRPVLEGFLRVAFPEHFKPGDLLRSLINKSEVFLDTDSQILSQVGIDELKNISEYANQFHHDTNPNWKIAVSNINKDELNGFVGRTLTFARKN